MFAVPQSTAETRLVITDVTSRLLKVKIYRIYVCYTNITADTNITFVIIPVTAVGLQTYYP
jgi:hypothetical protein